MNERTGRETLGQQPLGPQGAQSGAEETGAGYGNAQVGANAEAGGGMDSSGGTGSTGTLVGTDEIGGANVDGEPGSGASYGDGGVADQAVQRSETVDAESVEFEADESLIDDDQRRDR